MIQCLENIPPDTKCNNLMRYKQSPRYFPEPTHFDQPVYLSARPFIPLCDLHIPGRPQPNPTNRYIRKTITTPSSTINFIFFHHIFLFKPRLLTLKSCAPTPNLSVLSTNRSILSPFSRTLSMFSVMMPLTLSMSCCTFVIASCFPPSVVPYDTISFFN